jgi:hypothetical protein
MDQLRQSKYVSQQLRDKHMESNITGRFEKECKFVRYLSGIVRSEADSCASDT